jgi:hypothetical protein
VICTLSSAYGKGSRYDAVSKKKSTTLTFLQPANVLGNNPVGSFALVVEKNIGWVSKDVAKEIGNFTKDVTEVSEWLKLLACIKGPVSQALIFVGFGREENLLPFEKDAIN